MYTYIARIFILFIVNNVHFNCVELASSDSVYIVYIHTHTYICFVCVCTGTIPFFKIYLQVRLLQIRLFIVYSKLQCTNEINSVYFFGYL